MSSSEGYILNSVSQGGPLWAAWRAIDSGAGTKDEIVTATGLTSNQISNALRGLTYLRMIEQVDEYDSMDLSYGRKADRLNFSMTALNNIARECSVPSEIGEEPNTRSDWGKQAVLPLTLEYFISKNRQYFDRKNNQTLADNIDQWQRDQKFWPEDGDGERNDMNGNKLDNWTRIVELFGLVRPADGTNYTVYLTPELVSRLLEEGAEALAETSVLDSGTTVDIREWLAWVSENFFRVSLTQGNDIPEVLAQTLVELSERGQIRLVEATDADSVGLQGISKPQTMQGAANCIRIQ